MFEKIDKDTYTKATTIAVMKNENWPFKLAFDKKCLKALGQLSWVSKSQFELSNMNKIEVSKESNPSCKVQEAGYF